MKAGWSDAPRMLWDLAQAIHRTSAVGARHHNHHAIYYYYNQNFAVSFIQLPQSKTNPVPVPLPSCCTRHFSLPHYTPGFSRINLDDTNHGK